MYTSIQQLRELHEVMDIEFAQAVDRGALDAVFLHFPWPMWVKRRVGGRWVMRDCNAAYRRKYGIDPDEYRGAEDREVWDEPTANQFATHDQTVAETGEAQIFHEAIPNPASGKKEHLLVMKFPVYVGPDFYGVGGCAIYIPPA